MENESKQVKRDTRKERIISLTQIELDDIVYYASFRAAKKALNNHYNGLIPWFDLFERDHANMLIELEQIKLRLELQDTNKKKVTQNMVNELVEEERKAKKNEDE